MELIQQIERWQQQIEANPEAEAADMDVAKRLVKHGIEALAEVKRLRGLFGEPLRVVVVQAIREATGCPDIKGRDGEYMSEKVLALAKDLLRSNKD